MKQLLEAINRGILRGLRENSIELLTDLDDENLDQMDSIQSKSINNKADYSIKPQLIDAIRTGKLSSRLKQLINDHNNFHKYKSIIKVNDKTHLLELIKIGQELFGDDGNFNWIDTSEITDMSYLFFKNRKFNGHIELWDVHNVTDMRCMFKYAEKFNQPIGDWDVSKVTDMSQMFYYSDFNRNISMWDVSNVEDMTDMFHGAKFNGDILNWDVSNVENMSWMFAESEFNGDISKWDVSSVEYFNEMFDDCPIKEEYKPKFKRK